MTNSIIVIKCFTQTMLVANFLWYVRAKDYANESAVDKVIAIINGVSFYWLIM